MLTLYFVRHGETELGPGIIAGSTDVALSARGLSQTGALRELWLDAAPDMLMASPMLRAQQTAQELSKDWNIEIRPDHRIVEMDFGDWEGRAWDDVCENDSPRFRRWSSDWVRERAPGGESLADVANRCASWLTEAGKRLDGKTVVVVAHSGSIRVLLCLALGLSLDFAMKFTVDYSRVTGVTISDQSTRCLFVNSQTVPATQTREEQEVARAGPIDS